MCQSLFGYFVHQTQIAANNPFGLWATSPVMALSCASLPWYMNDVLVLFFRFVLRHDVLKPTLAMLAPDTPPEILRNAVWAMSNFCRNCPDTPEFNSAVPLLQRMIFSEDEDILSDSLTALSYLTDSNPTTIAV